MKIKLLKYLVIICLLFQVSCTKNLSDQFRNPENYSQTGNLFGGLFSNMLYSYKLYIQDYGEYYWQFNAGMEIPGMCQLAERYITTRYAWFINFDDLSGTNGFGSAYSNFNLWSNRMNDFYTRMRAWAVLKDQLATVSGQQLADNKIYFSLATIMKDFVALLNVDFYNSIPYSQAFQGSQSVFFPKYDDPLEIYKSVLSDLKTIGEELPATYAAMSDLGKGIFLQQDFAFKGDISKWVSYTYALRLKYAMRISGVDATTAKTHLQDIITKNLLPTTDLNWTMPVDNAAIGGGTWARGLYENYFATFIPDILMRRMNRDSGLYQPGIDDPRLPVLAEPTKFFDYYDPSGVRNTRQYKGVTYNADANLAPYTADDRYYTGANSPVLSLQQNARSMYNMGTFSHNSKFPAYMWSVAEGDLFLAEAELKGLVATGKTAGVHIKDAVTHSTTFWYAMNAVSTDAPSYGSGRFGNDSAKYFYPAVPSAAVVGKYSDSIKTRFETRATPDDQMEVLMQQKFIHLNIMAPYECWAELRRTRHPFLEPMTYSAKVMKPFPQRLQYPRTELQTNLDNYLKVKNQDNFTTPIFWVPADRLNVLPYWPDYNYQ